MNEQEKIKCPYCGSTDLYKNGKTRFGTQQYHCKTCQKKNSGNKTHIKFSNPNKIKCPICGGTNLTLKGFNRSGTQRYWCHDCNKKVTATPIDNSLTLKEKQLIIMYHFNLGVSITDISKYTHRGFKTIKDYIEEYKEKYINVKH